MSDWLWLAAGLVLLVAGGELLVRGASRVAAVYGLSPLVIGLTIVAFGTSAPELAVSLQSVFAGAADVAIGNVVGSNIFNVLFILGASALIVPLTVTRRIVQVEVPIVIGVTLMALLCALDGVVGVFDGVLLLLVIVGYTFWVLRTSDDVGETVEESGMGGAAAMGVAVGGLAVLVLGARWLVAGAVSLAQTFGVSETVIGLTIIAAGTSLPEVFTSLVAAARGHRDIAIGNVLGSNVFNLTMILGTSAVAGGGLPVAAGVLTFDFVVMMAVAVACLPIFFTGHLIARWEGGLFLAYYAAYTAYLVLDATEHDRLPHFRDAMVYYALPLTAVTLAILAVRERVARR